MKSFKLRAVLTGVVIMASLLFAAPAWATFPGTNGLIVFAALPAPNAPGKQIFTIEPNGTGLRQITHLAGDATFPHWSPDGNRIVFELDHPSGEPFCSVELMNAPATATAARLRRRSPPTGPGSSSNASTTSPTWTPSGA